MAYQSVIRAIKRPITKALEQLGISTGFQVLGLNVDKQEKIDCKLLQEPTAKEFSNGGIDFTNPNITDTPKWITELVYYPPVYDDEESVILFPPFFIVFFNPLLTSGTRKNIGGKDPVIVVKDENVSVSQFEGIVKAFVSSKSWGKYYLEEIAYAYPNGDFKKNWWQVQKLAKFLPCSEFFESYFASVNRKVNEIAISANSPVLFARRMTQWALRWFSTKFNLNMSEELITALSRRVATKSSGNLFLSWRETKTLLKRQINSKIAVHKEAIKANPENKVILQQKIDKLKKLDRNLIRASNPLLRVRSKGQLTAQLTKWYVEIPITKTLTGGKKRQQFQGRKEASRRTRSTTKAVKGIFKKGR